MREYETVFILHPQVDDAGVDREIEAVKQTIEDGQGEVTGIHKWGRRRLAYMIRKATEGTYTLIRFHANPGVLKELDRRYKINESVLRHLTVYAVGEPTLRDFRRGDRRGGRPGGFPSRGGRGRPGRPYYDDHDDDREGRESRETREVRPGVTSGGSADAPAAAPQEPQTPASES